MTWRAFRLALAFAVGLVSAVTVCGVVGFASERNIPADNVTSTTTTTTPTISVSEDVDLVNQGYGGAVTVEYTCLPGVAQGKGGGSDAFIRLTDQSGHWGFIRYFPTCDGASHTDEMVVPATNYPYSEGQGTVFFQLCGSGCASTSRDVKIR